jgi:hypothetical protein
MDVTSQSESGVEQPAALRSVSAEINYAQGRREMPIDFTFDAGWPGVTVEPAEVRIYDARARAIPPSLDTEGFALVERAIAPINFGDPAEIRGTWHPAVRDLVKRLTGAAHVISWSSNMRFSERSPEASRTPVAGPARHVHTDFGRDFDPLDFKDPEFSAGLEAVLADTKGGGLARWKCFNVWQPITPPPQDVPLALCDASSLDLEDMLTGRGKVISRGIVNDVSIELSLFRSNPRHRWFYYSGLEPGDALVFTGVDMTAGPTRRAVAHTAFDDPSCPPNVQPRNSIEVRTMAIFDE